VGDATAAVPGRIGNTGVDVVRADLVFAWPVRRAACKYTPICASNISRFVSSFDGMHTQHGFYFPQRDPVRVLLLLRKGRPPREGVHYFGAWVAPVNPKGTEEAALSVNVHKKNGI